MKYVGDEICVVLLVMLIDGGIGMVCGIYIFLFDCYGWVILVEYWFKCIFDMLFVKEIVSLVCCFVLSWSVFDVLFEDVCDLWGILLV